MSEDNVWEGLDDDFFSSISEEVLDKSCSSGSSNCKTSAKGSCAKRGTRAKQKCKVATAAIPIKDSSITSITSLESLGMRLDWSQTNLKKQKTVDGSSSSSIGCTQSDKPKVYKRKNRRPKDTPLNRYKYGRLWVTDVLAQFWCEQQMVYKLDPPLALLGVPIVEPAEVTTGKSLHLARELQVEDAVQVQVTSAEDRFALKVLSLLDGVISLIQHGRPLRREIHIFGTPFNMGVYVSGIIDEIRCHQDTLRLEIVEFKTRMSNCMPAEPQKLTHVLQVMLYKQLFDEMVSGSFNKETFAGHFRLNLDRKLGKGLMSQINHKEADTLSKLFDLLFETMRGTPFISGMLIEYMCQQDHSTIGVLRVDHDEAWLRDKLEYGLSYWKGERDPQGVPVEECWKCLRCPFNDACAWKADLVKKHSLGVIKEIKPPAESPATRPDGADSLTDPEPSSEGSGSVSESDNVIVDQTVDNLIL